MTPWGGTVVLDSQGFSSWLSEDAAVMALLAAAHRNQSDLVVSAMTIVEVSHPWLNRRRLDRVLSRTRVEPVSERSARAAAALLAASGRHGHSHAIDATVAELASRQTRPVAVLTSDPDDLSRLCEPHVRIVPGLGPP
ncbi:MAG: hypothetical protein QM619_06505 [Micropruina sp.]|uniref:PIN domain-containing protein n=1 Tax=Micropruina sp. TaxID=2737536 RepID=UPI0039E6A809